jgi:hypothetical protein
MGAEVSAVASLVGDVVAGEEIALVKTAFKVGKGVWNFASHPSFTGALGIVEDAVAGIAGGPIAVAEDIGDAFGFDLSRGLGSISSAISMGAAMAPASGSTHVVEEKKPSIDHTKRGNHNVKKPGPAIRIDLPIIGSIAPINPGYGSRIDKNKSLPNQVNVEKDAYYMQNSGVDKNSLGSSGGRKRTFAQI